MILKNDAYKEVETSSYFLDNIDNKWKFRLQLLESYFIKRFKAASDIMLLPARGWKWPSGSGPSRRLSFTRIVPLVKETTGRENTYKIDFNS